MKGLRRLGLVLVDEVDQIRPFVRLVLVEQALVVVLKVVVVVVVAVVAAQ